MKLSTTTKSLLKYNIIELNYVIKLLLILLLFYIIVRQTADLICK